VRVPINLASEPFRRDRPVLLVSGLFAVLLAGLLGVLVFLILGERDRARETREGVAKLASQVAAIDVEQAKLESTLRQPANSEVLERSVLLNALVERKSISWTRIFSDLESVMPHNVRLVQVRLPQINSQNEVSLDMVVAAQEPAHVLELLKRLQASPLFGPVTLHTSQPPTQNQPQYQYRLSVNYAQKL
jgi:hypothetical protein